MVWSSYSAVSKGHPWQENREEGKIRYVCLCIAPRPRIKVMKRNSGFVSPQLLKFTGFPGSTFQGYH